MSRKRAWHYANASAEKADSDANSFVEKKLGERSGGYKNALDDSILKRLGAGAETAVNKLLLLTYDSEMFSCYSTGKQRKVKTVGRVTESLYLNQYERYPSGNRCELLLSIGAGIPVRRKQSGCH